EMGLEPVAFLDDDPAKQGSTILGVPVWGPLDRLPEAVRHLKVDEVLISMPSAPGAVVRKIIHACQEIGVAYRTIPALHEILSGQVLINQIRPVKVEDLLRREPVQLDLDSIASYLSGKVVLVTGAGGSIGSEIVRQVIRFKPRFMVLLGRGENSLYELEKEIRFRWPDLPYALVVADVRDETRLRQIFQRFRPQIVFHAAAHKHVPLMEANPEEAILNNVFGTQNVVQAALDFGVERLVNISTDKAVNPTSVMGASKRVAEYIVQAAAAQARPEQVLVSVRFGNVLGSRGSVVPLFQEQIRRGGPVTVTHPEMRRYFMTIPEAAQLVLQAAGLGDNGAVYVLDMGEPVKIVDLARDLIRLSGFSEEDIPIVFTGQRPGEKLFEELLTAEEGVTSSRHEKIFVARTPPVAREWLEPRLERLYQAARAGDAAAIRQVLQEMIPTYRAWRADAN
ncbi:MAG: polysaccharide biosynthesis protein, partial [Chloroflexi bacterium]|nr:polysaccharide biosynthesis protein [Chloroflexota bacterium]